MSRDEWVTITIAGTSVLVLVLRKHIGVPKSIRSYCIAHLWLHYDSCSRWVQIAATALAWATLPLCFGLLYVIVWFRPSNQTVAYFPAMTALIFLLARARDGLRDWIHLARILPVHNALESVTWHSAWTEGQYRDAMVEVLHAELGARQKAERPLRIGTGTRVDIWASYRNVEWYITIKKGLNNQQRLTLQGELEDILRDVKQEKRQDVGIVIIIGVQKERAGKIESHAAALEDHTIRRQLGSSSWVIRVPITDHGA